MFEYNIAEIISYVLFCLVIVPLGIVICRKLYIDTKNEEHKEKGKVIQRIMKTYCVVQCGLWPVVSAVFGLARFTKSSVRASHALSDGLVSLSPLSPRCSWPGQLCWPGQNHNISLF